MLTLYFCVLICYDVMKDLRGFVVVVLLFFVVAISFQQVFHFCACLSLLIKIAAI